MIKEGSKGDFVKAWQVFLGVNADGVFGPATALATRAFQAKCGLRDDGIVGDQTLQCARDFGFTALPDSETGITSLILANIFPGTKQIQRDRWLPAFNEFLPKYEITTKLRVAAFLATGGIETDYLRTTTEYASGDAYEGRKDLGNTQKGDGRKFKGHGFFQTTGRYNHDRVTKATFSRLGIDFVKNPEKLAEIPIAVESACIFWLENKLENYADKRDFFGVSGIVNRGDAKRRALHFDKREALYVVCLRFLPEKIF